MAHHPPGPRTSPFLETLHLTALSLWLCFLATSAISASIIFPTARKLNLSLPDFPGYETDHWKIAAGQIQQRIFLFCDAGQLGACLAAALTLGLLLVRRRVSRRPASGIRVLAISGASVVFAYYLMILAPRMNANAADYWAQARAGQAEPARAAQARFETDHPTASRCLAATAGFVLCAFVAGAWSISSPREEPPLQ